MMPEYYTKLVDPDKAGIYFCTVLKVINQRQNFVFVLFLWGGAGSYSILIPKSTSFHAFCKGLLILGQS